MLVSTVKHRWPFIPFSFLWGEYMWWVEFYHILWGEKYSVQLQHLQNMFPSCPISIWILVPHMSVGCCFLYHLGWGSIKEYQCFEIVENHIIFATSRNSSSTHETWTLQLNNTATPWHTQKESPFYLIIRLLFSTWVHWYVCRSRPWWMR